MLLFEITNNIDNIPDRSIKYYIRSFTKSPENIAFNKIPIKLRLLSHYDKASLIWVSTSIILFQNFLYQCNPNAKSLTLNDM